MRRWWRRRRVVRVSVGARAMGTRPEEPLEEGREGRRRPVWAAEESAEEWRWRGSVVAGTTAVVIVVTEASEASEASAATTASVSTASSVSSSTGLVWDFLGRVIRSRRLSRHGVRAVHVHLALVFLLLLLLLGLLALCYGSRHLVVGDVLGRERLVIGTLRGVGVRAATAVSPTRSTARSMSSAPAPKPAVAMSVTAVGAGAPRVLVPVLPASRLCPALPELGAGERRLAEGVRWGAVDAGASVVLHVPVEVSWPSHIAGIYLDVFRYDVMCSRFGELVSDGRVMGR